MDNPKTTTSTLSGFGLAILGTTCCALPIVLVTLGAGGAMASLVSNLPWLATMSKYEVVVFGLTALVLTYSWWQVRRVSQCSIADAKRLRWQRVMLRISTTMLAVSILAAYAAYPLVRWFDAR